MRRSSSISEVALETAALVVHVGENRQIRSLIERVFDAAQHQRAVGIGHVETMTPTVWLRLLRRERANWLGRYPSFSAARSMRLLGHRRNVACQRSVVRTIDTVVDENPLSFATSRIVTIDRI